MQLNDKLLVKITEVVNTSSLSLAELIMYYNNQKRFYLRNTPRLQDRIPYVDMVRFSYLLSEENPDPQLRHIMEKIHKSSAFNYIIKLGVNDTQHEKTRTQTLVTCPP